MPKCGNCKEHHETNRKVRECYLDAGKTTAPEDRPMSSKQSDFIDTLLDQLEGRVMSDEIAEAIQAIVVHMGNNPDATVRDASAYIEILIGMRTLHPHEIETKEETTKSDETEEGLCPRCGVSGDTPCKTKSGNEASVPHSGRYATAS